MLLSTPLITPGFLAVIAVAKVVGVFKLWILRRIVPRVVAVPKPEQSSKAHTVKTNGVTSELAAIPALNLAPVVYLPVILLNAMDSMNKTDLVLHLRAYGEEPPEEWTKMELKQRIKDLMDRGEMPAIKTSKERTPLQVATGELNKASRKKADLIKYVAAEYQIEATSNDTIGTMQRKAMVKIMERTTPVGSDVMGFGKFASRTYHDVWSTETNYVEWARQTEMEGDVSIYLKRFIRWVKDHAETEEINATRKVTPKAKAKPSPKSKGPPKGYRAETHEEAPSSSSTSPDVAALTAVVAQLVQEVQAMKEEKGEKPRKLVARDTEMNHKDNR